MKLALIFLFILNFTIANADTYIVPTDIPELKEWASFNINDAEIDAETLSFTLPAELGSSLMRKVVFERSTEIPNTYTSTFGIAHCLQNPQGQINCQVQYNNIYKRFLSNLLPQTEAELQESINSAQELANRIDLARSFSTDPIGVLLLDI